MWNIDMASSMCIFMIFLLALDFYEEVFFQILYQKFTKIKK